MPSKRHCAKERGPFLHAGNAQYLPSEAVDTIDIGKYSSSTTLTIDTEAPTATEPVTFTVVVASAAAGKLANVNVMLTYGDGSSNTSITDANGAATFTHIYAQAGNFSVVATFAGEATQSPWLMQLLHTSTYDFYCVVKHGRCIDTCPEVVPA